MQYVSKHGFFKNKEIKKFERNPHESNRHYILFLLSSQIQRQIFLLASTLFEKGYYFLLKNVMKYLCDEITPVGIEKEKQSRAKNLLIFM
jgi:hypothetical protein